MITAGARHARREKYNLRATPAGPSSSIIELLRYAARMF